MIWAENEVERSKSRSRISCEAIAGEDVACRKGRGRAPDAFERYGDRIHKTYG